MDEREGTVAGACASAGPTGRPGGPSALRVPLLAQLLDQTREIVESPAAQAGHPGSVEAVQKLPAAPAAHQEGDKVSRLPVVQDLHHAGFLRKPHTGLHSLKSLDLR